MTFWSIHLHHWAKIVPSHTCKPHSKIFYISYTMTFNTTIFPFSSMNPNHHSCVSVFFYTEKNYLYIHIVYKTLLFIVDDDYIYNIYADENDEDDDDGGGWWWKWNWKKNGNKKENNDGRVVYLTIEWVAFRFKSILYILFHLYRPSSSFFFYFSTLFVFGCMRCVVLFLSFIYTFSSQNFCRATVFLYWWLWTLRLWKISGFSLLVDFRGVTRTIVESAKIL